MSRNTARRLAASAAALVGAAALSGCVSDPAFFETLAVAADTLASELAEDCQSYGYSYGYGYGYAPSYCAYGYDPYATVYIAPTYAEPRHHARDRDHHHRDRRQDRRRDRRRGGK